MGQLDNRDTFFVLAFGSCRVLLEISRNIYVLFAANIPGCLPVISIHCNVTRYGKPQSAISPSRVQPIMEFVRFICTSIGKRFCHRTFCDAIGTGYPTWEREWRSESMNIIHIYISRPTHGRRHQRRRRGGPRTTYLDPACGITRGGVCEMVFRPSESASPNVRLSRGPAGRRTRTPRPRPAPAAAASGCTGRPGWAGHWQQYHCSRIAYDSPAG